METKVTDYKEVSKELFISYLRIAQDENKLIAASTSPVVELVDDNASRTYYMRIDRVNGCNVYRLSGYAISNGDLVSAKGELTSLYSTMKGQGKELHNSAIENGATHLDCFDGYLATFYGKAGFTIDSRVANWTQGEPDVLFMSLK